MPRELTTQKRPVWPVTSIKRGGDRTKIYGTLIISGTRKSFFSQKCQKCNFWTFLAVRSSQNPHLTEKSLQ